jgi:hypothetical protein
VSLYWKHGWSKRLALEEQLVEATNLRVRRWREVVNEVAEEEV